MKTLTKIAVWIAWVVALGGFSIVQASFIGDPFLNNIVLIIEMVVLTVWSVWAKARVKARTRQVDGSQSV